METLISKRFKFKAASRITAKKTAKNVRLQINTNEIKLMAALNEFRARDTD